MTILERCQLAKEKGYSYSPVSGEIKGVRGNVIISKNKKGYSYVQLYHQNKYFVISSHRLAWYLHYGSLPNNSIDHIDGVRSNNKIDNLRDVTNQQNMWNRTTAKGYCWSKFANKFHARIKLNGREIHLGYFHTEEEARNAYLKAKETYHIIA